MCMHTYTSTHAHTQTQHTPLHSHNLKTNEQIQVNKMCSYSILLFFVVQRIKDGYEIKIL